MHSSPARRIAVLTSTVAIAIAATAATPKGTAQDVRVTVAADHATALYRCGETAVFRIAVTRDGTPVTHGTVQVNLTLGGGKPIKSAELILHAGKTRIEAALKAPGFILCHAEFSKGVSGYAGAGFDPERIRPVMEDPADFDAFWRAGRERLARTPLDARIAPIPKESDEKQQSFAVSFANIDGTRIYGFLSVPRGKKPPFPAWVTVPGAGPGFTHPSTGWAERGALTLMMNVHSYDTTRLRGKALDQAYAELNKKGRYPRQGAPDREKYFFRRAILGIDRAVRWLASRPDWDRKHLVVDGSSQGGGMALILAGLNPGTVTAAAANVPALCDHAAYLAGRRPGWPQLAVRAPENRRAGFLRMAAYFDAVNFARRIRCPVIMSAGFIDRTCPPASVYAAYNVLSTPKRIFPGPQAGHAWTVGGFRAFHDAWVAGQLGLTPAAVPPTGP